MSCVWAFCFQKVQRVQLNASFCWWETIIFASSRVFTKIWVFKFGQLYPCFVHSSCLFPNFKLAFREQRRRSRRERRERKKRKELRNQAAELKKPSYKNGLLCTACASLGQSLSSCPELWDLSWYPWEYNLISFHRIAQQYEGHGCNDLSEPRPTSFLESKESLSNKFRDDLVRTTDSTVEKWILTQKKLFCKSFGCDVCDLQFYFFALLATQFWFIKRSGGTFLFFPQCNGSLVESTVALCQGRTTSLSHCVQKCVRQHAE